MQITNFSPQIYPYELWVGIGTDLSKVQKQFWDINGDPIVFYDDIDDLQAFVLEVMHKRTRLFGTIIIFRALEDITFKVVAHEASHFAKNLFAAIGADSRPHEPFEYLVGWAAECCEKAKIKFEKTCKKNIQTED